MERKTKVLIVDDSAIIRNTLVRIISDESWIQITGTAEDPYLAVKKIATEKPDVIILDIEMPRMNGISFLRKIMSQHPIPVIVFSSIASKGSNAAIMALEYGAVDVIKKPGDLQELKLITSVKLIDAIKAASKARIKRLSGELPTNVVSATKATSKVHSTKVIAIGASTGGTTALPELLRSVHGNCYGIVVVQHMPELFTRPFAERLDRISNISVKEACHGDEILRGCALIAPGNRHVEIRKFGTRYYVDLTNHDPVNRHKPSVDVLFHSVAKHAAQNGIGLLLTGMGADGAAGLLAMKNMGAETVAQDEESSVVFGMPREAIELNAANRVLPLQQMARFINNLR